MKPEKGAVATQRLFFALWPEEALQRQLAMAAAALLPQTAGRRVRPENLHCTLVFLGNVEAGQRLCVEAAATTLAPTPSFTLVFDRFGYFRGPQVAWLGCSYTPPVLLDLVAQLGRGCAACGSRPSSGRTQCISPWPASCAATRAGRRSCRSSGGWSGSRWWSR